MEVMKGYMLDTNVFNRVLRDNADPARLPKPTFVTHIQRDELSATKDSLKREALLKVLDDAEADSIATASAAWDVSNWDESEWGSNDGVWESMLAALNQLNKGRKNNTQDILIAETAIRKGHILVTDDAHLAAVTQQLHGQVMSLRYYLARAQKAMEGRNERTDRS